jgi:hypothetical protein
MDRDAERETDSEPTGDEAAANDSTLQDAPVQQPPRMLPRADAYPFRIILTEDATDTAPTRPLPAVPPSATVPTTPKRRQRLALLLLILAGGLLLLGMVLLALRLGDMSSVIMRTTTGTTTGSGTTPGGMSTPGVPTTPTPLPHGTPGTQPTTAPVVQATGTPAITATPGTQPTAPPTPEPTAPPSAPAKMYVTPNPTSMSCLPGGMTSLSVDNDGGQTLSWKAATDTTNVTVTPAGTVAPNTSGTATVRVTLLQLSSFHVNFQANGSVPMVSVLVTCS